MRELATRIGLGALLAVQLLLCPKLGRAGDLKIPIPERGISTPTQKLNREGVAELKRGHRKKAEQLFYKAYLLDPQDPFTLNNLGYMAELEGDATRALRYYALAGQEHTDAVIAESSVPALKGKTLDDVYKHVQDSNQAVSQINERAIVLLQNGQVFAAKNLLLSAVQTYPRNPFLLNNLGFAMESVGDLQAALQYYSAAASLHSTQKVVVTPRAKWRGRVISEVAQANAVAIRQQISRGEGVEAAAARLNLRGVAALNDNKPMDAWQFFRQAYQRDAQNAFTLNNMGYISELEGDWESAASYYEAARSGHDANARVGYSTRPDAEGQKIDNLAGENRGDVDTTLKTMQQTRRRGNQPVELIPRGAASGGISEINDQEEKPVPPVGVQAPALPPLPPPGSDNRPQNPDRLDSEQAPK